MKIDLLKLGLSKEATFDEIQAKLTEMEVYDKDEVNHLKNEAATGARKATEAKLKSEQSKNTFTEEEIEEFTKYKTQNKKNKLKENTNLSKLSDEDFELIVKAEKLLDTSEEELDAKIDEISKTYSKRFKNDLPPMIEPNDDSSESNDSEKFEGL